VRLKQIVRGSDINDLVPVARVQECDRGGDHGLAHFRWAIKDDKGMLPQCAQCLEIRAVLNENSQAGLPLLQVCFATRVEFAVDDAIKVREAEQLWMAATDLWMQGEVFAYLVSVDDVEIPVVAAIACDGCELIAIVGGEWDVGDENVVVDRVAVTREDRADLVLEGMFEL
jgi:hypothetical protein